MILLLEGKFFKFNIFKVQIAVNKVVNKGTTATVEVNLKVFGSLLSADSVLYFQNPLKRSQETSSHLKDNKHVEINVLFPAGRCGYQLSIWRGGSARSGLHL